VFQDLDRSSIWAQNAAARLLADDLDTVVDQLDRAFTKLEANSSRTGAIASGLGWPLRV